MLDLGPVGYKQIVLQTDITIPNIFRGQRKQDFPAGPSFKGPGENVEKNEKCRLAAICQGDVLRPYVPAKLAPEQGGNRLDEFPVAAGRVIIPDGPLEFVAVAQQLLHTASKALLDLRYMGGISSAEH